LKYSARFWRIPTKQAAQHARHTSTAAISSMHQKPIEEKDELNIRWPSAAAFCWTAFRINLRRSRIVTIKDPNAIEPRESVDARPNAERVGCFGCS
jgi:hypothetical protein